MKFIRLLPVAFILIFSSYLLAEALPSQLITITQSKSSMQIVYQNSDWTVVDSQIAIAGLQLTESNLPAHTIMLGVPTGDIEMRIVSAESTPTQLNQPLTKTELVTLNTNLQRRDQPIAQLTFNPVQQHGDSANVYTKIIVELTWEHFTEPLQKPNHPAYEKLLAETLFNYSSLDRPTPQTARLPQVQQRNSTSPTLRITISESGLYYLPFAILSSAGLPTDDPAQLHLTHRKQPVATTLYDDGLLFFGEAYEDLYTDENVYWLTVGAGTEMATINESHPTAPVATQFSKTVHLEENTIYWNTMPNGTGQDHWFWGERISPNSSGLESSRSFTATLPTVSSTPTATLRVQLKGYTTLDHKTRISLNNHLIDEQIWTGQTVHTHTIPVTGSLLVAGENVITIEAVDAGAVVDQLYVNWIEIDYASTYTAIDDTIFFTAPTSGTFAFTVTGFTTNTLHLFDITNPYQPQQISHTVSNGSLNFQQTVTDGTRFFATANKSVPQTALDSVSHWRDEGNSADWLIIAHSDFITPAHRLAAHRTTQGLQTAVVDIQDVYDEFGDGFFNPDAIRDFLAYTYDNWQSPAPTYVVLLGDGSQDYKDQTQSGSRNFIPPHMIETFDRGQIPSDHWYVTFEGNDVFEEMFIGRLSAETLPQANAIVDNIISYENRPAPNRQLALFVADDRETIFETNSEQLIDRLPTFFDVERIYARVYTTARMTRDISQTLLSGATFVNYSGHGNYYRWGSYVAKGRSHRIFTEIHADLLTNSGLNPFITIADCLNGFFSIPSGVIIEPYNEALAEALQRPVNGGAIAIWTDAGLGYTSGQRILMNAFYNTLFTDQMASLGSATNIAKTELYNSSSFWEQNVRTMTLFGDPATRLKTNVSIPTSISFLNLVVDSRISNWWIAIIFSSLILAGQLICRKAQKVNSKIGKEDLTTY